MPVPRRPARDLIPIIIIIPSAPLRARRLSMEPIPLPHEPPPAFQEIRMMHGLLRADPARRIIHEQTLQQIQPLLTKHLNPIRVHQLVVRLALPLGETRLEVREGRDAGPLRLGGRAEDAEDLEDLVDLAVAREERLARRHLRVDAADTPHVDARAVLPAAEQDLRRAVPERDDLVGVGAEGHAEGPREPEVGEFEVAFFVDEEVLGFEVAVQHAVGVAVARSFEQLVGEFLDLRAT